MGSIRLGGAIKPRRKGVPHGCHHRTGSGRHRDPAVHGSRLPEADLEDLRARIAATRWPEKETVEDDSQGVPLAMMQDLARYWLTEYDWRKCEARLNSLPQFITEIDGLDIHFIHVRSKHEDALPIVVCHGWPGSVVEQLKLIEPADRSHRPRRERVGRLPRRDPVDARVRVLGQADHAPAGIPSASARPTSS